MKKKQDCYKVVCVYKTVCTTTLLEWADSEEEAIEKAEYEFKQMDKELAKNGKFKRELINMKVIGN